MCDIWKANSNKKEISAEELQKHVHHFKKLGVREIVFSGGEALMHSILWRLCSLLREQNIKVTLLSTGLLLEKNAKEIIDNINEVIISVDGSKQVHDRIRNIPNGFEKLSDGVKALRKLNSKFRITARCVLQRYNFEDFTNTVKSTKEVGFDQISFLAADISTSAFNHTTGWRQERVSEVALNKDETAVFEKIIKASFIELSEAYDSKFIAESPTKMLKVVQYYRAINGADVYPQVICNAPWVSAVIESDGSVMPCFFHKPYGNIYENDFDEIINSREAIQFRKNLDIKTNPICKKCVCSLRLGLRQRA
jgi:MoaA/NifB/PqqE/SkfB family radical SAM enzyme